jgi:hypothetical protein
MRHGTVLAFVLKPIGNTTEASFPMNRATVFSKSVCIAVVPKSSREDVMLFGKLTTEFTTSSRHVSFQSSAKPKFRLIHRLELLSN